MPNSDQTADHQELSPLKPMPAHLFDALLAALRSTLGTSWGVTDKSHVAWMRDVRKNLNEVEGVYVAADPNRDRDGLHVDIWVDVADLNPGIADTVATEILQASGGQEVLLMCREYEDDGIRYRFACGSIEGGMVGSVRLIGPYARDVAHLGRLGSGHISGFSA